MSSLFAIYIFLIVMIIYHLSHVANQYPYFQGLRPGPKPKSKIGSVKSIQGGSSVGVCSVVRFDIGFGTIFLMYMYMYVQIINGLNNS